MANDKFIEELSNKLRDHASDVNPQMWQGISSQIGAGASGAAGGLGLAKIAGIVGIAVTSVAVTYFALNSSPDDKPKETITAQNSSEKTATEIEESKEAKSPSIVEADVKQEIKENPVKEEKVSEVKPIQQNKRTSTQGETEKTIVTPMAPEEVLFEKEKVTTQTVKEPVKPEVKTKVAETTTVEKAIEEKPTVEIAQQKEKESNAKFITLPNIFTPNNDGVNDEFFVQSTGMFNYQLVVMNANNKVVWSSNDPNAKWDGRDLGGEKLPNGSYIYFITAEDERGNPIQEHKRLEIK